jgi:hypothetical protein
VFNEASVLEPWLNRNFYTAIPGIVTGLGLLFTFIAILFALLDVKLGGPTNRQFTGLDKLVSGLSGKFLTSIVALLAATVFLSYEKRCLHNLTQSLRDLVAALPVIVTNREFTPQAQRAATECGVEVITAKQLWRLLAEARCTYYDVLALEDRRLASMRKMPEALRQALSS